MAKIKMAVRIIRDVEIEIDESEVPNSLSRKDLAQYVYDQALSSDSFDYWRDRADEEEPDSSDAEIMYVSVGSQSFSAEELMRG